MTLLLIQKTHSLYFQVNFFPSVIFLIQIQDILSQFGFSLPYSFSFVSVCGGELAVPAVFLGRTSRPRWSYWSSWHLLAMQVVHCL